MTVTHDDLNSFQQFAVERIRTAGAESLDELFDLWRLEHPTPDDEGQIHAAIRQGLADVAAGRGRPVEEVMAELNQKFNLPAE